MHCIFNQYLHFIQKLIFSHKGKTICFQFRLSCIPLSTQIAMTFCFIEYQFENRLKSPAFNQPLINIFKRSDQFQQLVDDLVRECKIQGKKRPMAVNSKEKAFIMSEDNLCQTSSSGFNFGIVLKLIKLVSFRTFFHKKVFELEK